MDPELLPPLYLPPRYSELAWDLIEAEDPGEHVPEVLRGFNPELVIYGFLAVIRSVLACVEACDFVHDQDTIKRFQLEAHYEEHARQTGGE